MPKHVWRRHEVYERKAADKRHGKADEPKARAEPAEYLAGRFAQANWEITHPEPENRG